ncbi:hypothetical protein AB0885_40930 [Streptomyces sp. NPDC005534]
MAPTDTVLGTAAERREGPDKVTGRARYACCPDCAAASPRSC